MVNFAENPYLTSLLMYPTLLMSVIVNKVHMCPSNCLCSQPDEEMFFEHYYVACENMELSEVPKTIELRTTDLSLAGNQLNTLKDSSIDRLMNIVTLYLQQNDFIDVDEDTVNILSSLPRLRAMDLSDNPWDCSCTSGMKAFVKWLERMRGPQPMGGGRWIALINGHRSTCATPAEMAGRRLDRLKLGDICSSV